MGHHIIGITIEDDHVVFNSKRTDCIPQQINTLSPPLDQHQLQGTTPHTDHQTGKTTARAKIDSETGVIGDGSSEVTCMSDRLGEINGANCAAPLNLAEDPTKIGISHSQGRQPPGGWALHRRNW